MSDLYDRLESWRTGVEWLFSVLDADAEPPLYTFKIVDTDVGRERPLFSRTGDTGCFHVSDTEDGPRFDRHKPSDELRLAVAQASEGTVPPEEVDELPPWEADWLRCVGDTHEHKPDAIPWGVHRWVDDCCAEYRGAVESASLEEYGDADDDDTGE